MIDKIKAKLAVFKAKLNKINKIKANTLADLLTVLAFIIIFATTFVLNRYVAMYLLAVILLIVSYFTAQGGEK